MTVEIKTPQILYKTSTIFNTAAYLTQHVISLMTSVIYDYISND